MISRSITTDPKNKRDILWILWVNVLSNVDRRRCYPIFLVCKMFNEIGKSIYYPLVIRKRSPFDDDMTINNEMFYNACVRNRFDSIQRLLKTSKRYRLNVAHGKNRCVYKVCEIGTVKTFNVLYDRDVVSSDFDHARAIHSAFLRNNYNMIRKLTEEFKDKYNLYSLIRSKFRSKDKNIYKIWESIYDSNSNSRLCYRTLHMICSYGREDLFEYFSTKKDVPFSTMGVEALNIILARASKTGDQKTVRFITKRDVPLDRKNIMACILKASDLNHDKIVRIIGTKRLRKIDRIVLQFRLCNQKIQRFVKNVSNRIDKETNLLTTTSRIVAQIYDSPTLRQIAFTIQETVLFFVVVFAVLLVMIIIIEFFNL